MQYKIIFRKQWKLLKIFSALTAPVCGVVVGQENRLDVTNPHTERFFFKFEKSSRCGGLVQNLILREQQMLQTWNFKAGTTHIFIFMFYKYVEKMSVVTE